MEEKRHSWRKHASARFAWIRRKLRDWGNPWLVGLWLSGVIAAVVLTFIPGDWISITRRFPDFPSIIADAIELSSHFLGFAVLVGLASLACNTRAHLVLVYLAALFIGISLEMAQIFVPQRGASFEDVSMNVLGASAGFLFGLARLRKKTRASPGGQGR